MTTSHVTNHHAAPDATDQEADTSVTGNCRELDSALNPPVRVTFAERYGAFEDVPAPQFIEWWLRVTFLHESPRQIARTDDAFESDVWRGVACIVERLEK